MYEELNEEIFSMGDTHTIILKITNSAKYFETQCGFIISCNGSCKKQTKLLKQIKNENHINEINNHQSIFHIQLSPNLTYLVLMKKSL
jgi:hypothetical protein